MTPTQKDLIPFIPIYPGICRLVEAENKAFEDLANAAANIEDTIKVPKFETTDEFIDWLRSA